MDIHALVGKVIVFNSRVEKSEIDFDVGMKAKVIDYDFVGDDCWKLNVDFKEFEEDNKKLMKANYYDNNQVPCLKWSETKSYPKDGKDIVYVMGSEVKENKAEFELVEI